MSANAYDANFMAYTAHGSRYAAEVVTAQLASLLGVRSVLDVGCARGTWLSMWRAQGVNDLFGIDGDYIDPASFEISADAFMASNLNEAFDVRRRFDLVQCLEVAEHLPADGSKRFIETLTAHAERYVLFSAAPPGQGGESHINERSYDFWRSLFEARQFSAFDFVRPRIAKDRRIPFWYRYNVMLYVRNDAVPGLPAAVAQSEVPRGKRIADVSPPLFKLRKSLVRLLPLQVQNVLARLKASVLAR